MNRFLTVVAAVPFLIAVSACPRIAFAAATGPAGAVQPQAQSPAKAPVRVQDQTPTKKAPVRMQDQTQAAPQAAQEPTISALPVIKKVVQRPVLQNVDLRPDVVSTIQTEPFVPMNGLYQAFTNQGKPLKVTAVVENAGFTKADKVQINVIFSRIPGVPMKQNQWAYQYTVDLGPGESVSYPLYILFYGSKVEFRVVASFAGEEKSKGNNLYTWWVRF